MDTIKKGSTISLLTYLGDQQGCGHIRVIFPSLILNLTRKREYKFQSFYTAFFNNDPLFYKNFTAVQFQRASTPNHLQLLLYYRDNIRKLTRTPLLYEIDDLLTEIPEYNYAHYYYREQADIISDILKLVDGIIVSTDKLKEEFSKYNNRIGVLHNHLPKFLWGDIEPRHLLSTGKPRIMWAGSSNHFPTPKVIKDNNIKEGDIYPELFDFIKKTTDKYQWVIMGGIPMDLEEEINNGKIEFHGWADSLSYPRIIKGLKADIGFAPLVDNTFNRCKSNIKALEYTALGIPGVYSNVEPYKDMCLTANNADEMISHIESLANDVDKRRYTFEKDYDTLKDQLWWEENNNAERFIECYLNVFNKTMYEI
jgi:O-antigen biosynthesis protein